MEPITKADLKAFFAEIRGEIKQWVAEGFRSCKPAAEAQDSGLQVAVDPLDLSALKACSVEGLSRDTAESSSSPAPTTALMASTTPPPTTGDAIPVFAAATASDGTFDEVANTATPDIVERSPEVVLTASTGLIITAPTTCSMEGLGRETTESWSAPAQTMAPTVHTATVDIDPVLVAPAASDGTMDDQAVNGIASTPTTCLRVCRPQHLVAAPVLVASPTEYSIDSNNIPAAALPLAMSCEFSSILAPTVHVQRPMPWPSFMSVHADGDETRPLPWPSFRICAATEFPILDTYIMVRSLALKLLPNGFTSITLLTVSLESGNCAALSWQYLGVANIDYVGSWLFVRCSVAVCQESSVQSTFNCYSTMEFVAGQLRAMEWHLLDFPCRYIVPACLLDHYLGSSQPHELVVLNTMRRPQPAARDLHRTIILADSGRPFNASVVLPDGKHCWNWQFVYSAIGGGARLLQEYEEGISCGLISRVTSVFQLWANPRFKFLFLDVTSEEVAHWLFEDSHTSVAHFNDSVPYGVHHFSFALFQWEIAWQLVGSANYASNNLTLDVVEEIIQTNFMISFYWAACVGYWSIFSTKFRFIFQYSQWRVTWAVPIYVPSKKVSQYVLAGLFSHECSLVSHYCHGNNFEGVHRHVAEIKSVQLMLFKLILLRAYLELSIGICLYELQLPSRGMDGEELFWENKKLELNNWVSYMLEQYNARGTYGIKTEFHSLCESSSRTLTQATRTPHSNKEMELCMAARYLFIHQKQRQSWMSHEFAPLCYCCTTPLAAQGDDADGIITRKQYRVQVQRTKVPWDPGGSTWCLWCSTCDEHQPFQGGRYSIAVTTFVEQVSAGDKHYLDFNQVRASDNYYMGTSFVWVPADNAYCSNFGYYHDSNQVKDHPLQWDPGGFSLVSAWGQAEFQGGRGVSNLACVELVGPQSWAGDDGLGPTNPPSLLHISSRKQRRDHPVGSRTRNGGGGEPYLPTSPLIPHSPLD